MANRNKITVHQDGEVLGHIWRTAEVKEQRIAIMPFEDYTPLVEDHLGIVVRISGALRFIGVEVTEGEFHVYLRISDREPSGLYPICTHCEGSGHLPQVKIPKIVQPPTLDEVLKKLVETPKG